MTFLAPVFLWTLTALAALGAIYFLKVRPRKKPVTAYFLWQKIFTEKKAAALFKRLRDLWSLLLMALAFAAVALALAEPDFAGDERKDLLIVIDNSASMSARSGTSTRLEEAKDKACDIIAGLNGSQRASIASFADNTVVRAHPTRHRKGLIEAINGIGQTQLPSRVEALRALQPGNERVKNIRVLLITDGCFPAGERPAEMEVLHVGDDSGNLGVTHADLRAVPGGAGRLGFFLTVVSSFKKEISTDILLTHVDSGRMMKVIPVKLQPGENPAITLTLDDAPSGKWRASLELEDAFALDNTVALFVPPVEPLRVGVLGGDPFFLQNVVGAFERSDQLLTLSTDSASAQLLLGRSLSPQGKDAVVFQPLGDSPFWAEVGEELAAPVPQVMVKDHAMLRYLNAETIKFSGARKLKAPSGAVVLVADESGVPLLYLARSEGNTVCVVNLDPLAAQFYLSAWFPVLIHNAAVHLAHRERMLASTLATGSQPSVPGLAENTPATLTDPEGRSSAIKGGDPVPLTQYGFYEIKHENGGWTAGVSLIAPEESMASVEVAKDTVKPLASGQAPSYWLMAFAVALVIGESVLYDRRKVG